MGIIGHMKETKSIWDSQAPIGRTESYQTIGEWKDAQLIGRSEPTPMYSDQELPDLCPCGNGFIGTCECGADN
jgi:hypothetical protein